MTCKRGHVPAPPRRLPYGLCDPKEAREKWMQGVGWKEEKQEGRGLCPAGIAVWNMTLRSPRRNGSKGRGVSAPQGL